VELHAPWSDRVSASRPRRRVKVRAGHLGPLLCWAVVFADIGTSIYYTPGILYGHFSGRSAIFVGMTLVVFFLLTLKYSEVAWRYPEGGGVVTVASRALHPFAGLLGGLLILVDYYLTAALSALSGFQYLAVIVPPLEPLPVAVALTVAALVVLGLLNWLGIKESARVSMLFAATAAVFQLLVVIATVFYLGPDGIVRSFKVLAEGPRLTPVVLITGYAAAFLAFSGLESIAQLAPAMREPRRTVAGRAMALVVLTMVVTSPLLTLWSTTLLSPEANPNQFISLLGTHVAGQLLGAAVAISGALLLVFASNTAIIGAYHVFLALTRMGFLPRVVEKYNAWRRTPHVAILLSIALPIAVVIASRGSVDLLGDLYAFGLLGAFVLTCLALDVVRWHERSEKGAWRWWLGYGVGVLTTVLVVAGWSTNLVQKPLATMFGGGLTVVGLIVGLATYAYTRRRRPVVFPFRYRPGHRLVQLQHARQLQPAQVLVVLPHDHSAAEAVIQEAARAAAGRSAAFLYRGEPVQHAESGLLEITDPYLKDYAAQDAFARAESLTRKKIPDRRYIYVSGNLPPAACGRVWRDVSALETVVLDGEQDVLPAVPLDRVRRSYKDGVPVLHLVPSKLRPAPRELEAQASSL
jgi:amino acid transporter